MKNWNKPLKRVGCLLGLSLGIGLLGGIASFIFGQGLQIVTNWRQNLPNLSYLLFLPLGFLVVFSGLTWGKTYSGGMGRVFQVGQGRKEDLPVGQGPFVALMTWISHLAGASVGREGVAVQLGASLAMFFSQFSWQVSRTLLVQMGMAAGFAGLFGTPLTATIFALEVLELGVFRWRNLQLVMIAAFSASTLTHYLELAHFSPNLPVLDWSWSYLALAFLAVVIFTLVGKAFAIFLIKGKKVLNQWLPSPYWRMAGLGSLLLLMYLLVTGDRYQGLGTNLIAASFGSGEITTWDWLFKLALTVLSLLAGFQGGEVTPLFAIGSSLGVVLAGFLGLPIALVAALGYVAVFGAATSTAWTALVLFWELFGNLGQPLYGIALLPLFLLARGVSIYDQQLLGKGRK